MISLRIQNLQWAAGLLTALGCLLLGGESLHSNWSDYERYKSGADQLTRFHAALVAANAVSAERGPSNALMAAVPDREMQSRVALADKRAETERSIAALEADFSGEIGASNETRGLVAALRVRLETGRAAVDMVAARPLGDRDGRSVAKAIEAMFSAADDAATLRDSLGRRILRLTPQIATEIILNMTANTLREQAGRLGSYLNMMMMAAGDDSRYLARFEETDARLRELQSVIENYAGAYFVDGPVETAIAQMRTRYFEDAVPYAREMADPARRPAGIGVSDVLQTYVSAMASVEAVRVEIVQTSLRKMNRLRNHALTYVVLSGFLTGLTILVLTVTAIIFRHALFRPLLLAREQVISIARGDLSEPARTSRISQEIGEMFEGLTILREEQRQKQLLENDQRRMTQQLKLLSETDALTGLLNRRALGEHAQRIFAQADQRGQGVGVVIFDVDHFKSVNDTYGHAVGDVVLQTIGSALLPLLRPSDVFARYGGEEFVLLLQNVQEAEAVMVSERVRTRLAEIVMSPEHGLRVTGSFGVALREPGSESGWETMIALADLRLYRAKQTGRNRVCAEGSAEADTRSAAA